MKKSFVLLFVLAFFPASLVFADRGNINGFSRGGDNGGDRGGNSTDGGGWDRGSNGDGNNSDNNDSWDRSRDNGNVQDRSVRNPDRSTLRSNSGTGGRIGSSQTYGRNNGVNRGHFGGSNDRSFTAHRSGYFSAPVPQKLRQMGVARVPRPITNRSQLLSGRQLQARPQPPQQGPNGKALRASVVGRSAMNSSFVRNNMSTISKDRGFTSQVNTLNSTEKRVNHYYWHSYNGNSYCHYYDHWGCNWYGWYLGGNCFWTQYYFGNWWWWDPSFDRWCYWNDGWWWWNDPYHMNVVYAYDNGQYVPAGADDANMSAAESSDNGVYRSQDGSRMVKISSSSRDAFLYDTAEPPAFKPVYLASGVKEVRFSNTQNGRPLQVMLILNDGSFDLFDESGNPDAGASY